MKTTLKTIAVAIAGLFFANSSMAQTYVQAGLNLANVSNSSSGSVNKNNYLPSLNVGVMHQFDLGTNFAIETGALLSGKGSKQEIYYTNSTTDNYTKRTFNPYYIEVPANLVVKLPVSNGVKLNVFAGPYAAAGVAGKVSGESSFLGIKSSFSNNIEFNNDNPFTSQQENASMARVRRFDYGANVGASLELSKVIFKTSYGYGLSKLGSTQDNNNDNNKHRGFSVSVGYKF